MMKKKPMFKSVLDNPIVMKHNRNDESHQGKIGICYLCLEQDNEIKLRKALKKLQVGA